jgi:undecaprenyl-diphosphatase
VSTPNTDRGRLHRFVAARLDRTSYLGLHLTLGLAALVLALWAFGALLGEILENAWLVRWDRATSLAIHEAATPGTTAVAQLVTNLGSPGGMGVLGACAVVLLWRRHRLLAQTWVAAALGGAVVDVVLKEAVRRARPPYGTRYLHIDSYSFPSGHAMAATIGFGMLAYVVHALRPGRGTAAAAYAAAALLTLVVCATRVYLGVHYPSDVAGGVVGGAAWLVICQTGAGVARGRAATRATPTA